MDVDNLWENPGFYWGPLACHKVNARVDTMARPDAGMARRLIVRLRVRPTAVGLSDMAECAGSLA